MSRPYKCPAYKYLRFVGAAQLPAGPTNDPHIKNYSTFFLLGSLTPTRERKIGRPWTPPKIALLRREDFGLKSFGGEIVKGKKILFYTFFKVLMVG